MQHHGSKYLPPDPPSTLGMGSIGQNSTFSEHGHVAYRLNGTSKCSNIVANFLPADHTPSHSPHDPRGKGSKAQNSTFSEHGHVAYQL